MPFSATGLLNDAQISLEKAATDKFGSVVDNFVAGGLGGLIPPAPVPGHEAPANRNDGSWYSTSYAAALAGGTSYRPKLKFLFKVEFIFTQAAKDEYKKIFGSASSNDFTFMIKSVDRPKIDFEYEEDVNMYNFRTKVLKKIRHRDLTIVFMDDTGNRVFNFFRFLMMINSPITRGQTNRDNTLDKPTSANMPVLGSGMAFGGTSDIAHRAVVNSTFGNTIETIRVKQIFVDPSPGGLQTASKMVTFDFMNPRIMSFDMDELSHESNDVSLLTMVFDYDWMEMVDVGALGTSKTPYAPDYNITVPGVHGAPSDISPNSTSSAQGSAAGSNSLIGALGGILGRGAQQLSADLLGKAVTSIAGKGRFATSLTGVATSALSGPIGGLVSGAARDQLGGLFSTISNPNARASAPVLTDSTSTTARPVASVVSSSAYEAFNPASST